MADVYRVEHRVHRCGPYTNRWALSIEDTIEIDQIIAAHNVWGDADHPPPCEDGLRLIEEHESCGFESLEALHAWFEPEVLRGLARFDYIIARYDCNPAYVRYGEKQLVYSREEASSRLETIEIQEDSTVTLTAPETVPAPVVPETDREAYLANRRDDEINSLRDQIRLLEGQASRFKESVRQTIGEAVGNGSVESDAANEILSSLGLPMLRVRARAKVQVTVEVDVEYQPGVAGYDASSTDFLQSSIYLDGVSLGGDSDVQSVDVLDERLTVLSVEAYDD